MLDTLKLKQDVRVKNPVMRLRSMSKTTAGLSNRLAADRPELSFELRDATVRVFPYDGVPGPGRRDWERIHLQIEERFYHLTFDQPVLQDLLDVSECFQDVAELASQSAAIVFEHLFSDVLGNTEAHLKESITITGHELSEEPDAGVFHLCFEATYPLLVGGSVRFLLGGSDDDLSFLVENICAFDRSDRPTASTDLPLPTTLISQNFQISISDLRAFVEMDVMLLNLGQPDDLARRMVVSDQIAGDLSRDGKGLRLSGSLKPLHHESQPEHGKGNTMSAPEEAPVAFDDLAVSLHIEVDRKEILLSELQSLAKGSVVPFDTRTPEMVKVFAGGRFFAEGELVRVDEQVGVRLIRMA